jgi:hypothetical protein
MAMMPALMAMALAPPTPAMATQLSSMEGITPTKAQDTDESIAGRTTATETTARKRIATKCPHATSQRSFLTSCLSRSPWQDGWQKGDSRTLSCMTSGRRLATWLLVLVTS